MAALNLIGMTGFAFMAFVAACHLCDLDPEVDRRGSYIFWGSVLLWSGFCAVYLGVVFWGQS